MIRSILIASAFGAVVLPAAAGTSFTAKLANSFDSNDTVVAAKAVWSCEGDTCVAELNRRTATVRTCKDVASEVGELVAFGTEKDGLSEADLEKCNKAAKK